MNVLASRLYLPVFFINVVDCTNRLVEGERKDGPFITNLFLPTILKVDPMKKLIDIVFFDGGSNMQLAGQIIQAVFL